MPDRPCVEHLREVLLRPLGRRAAFSHLGNTVRGHQNWFGFDIAPEEPGAPPYLAPAGVLFASARDLWRYGGMLVGDGTFAGWQVLPSSAVSELLSPLEGTAGPVMAWGVLGGGALEHAGNARTSSARVRLVTEEGYAVSVLVAFNVGLFFDASADLMDGVTGILAGEPAPSFWPRVIGVPIGTLVEYSPDLG